jgi:hypothetical protein
MLFSQRDVSALSSWKRHRESLFYLAVAVFTSYFTCGDPAASELVFPTCVMCYLVWSYSVVYSLVKKLKATKKLEDPKYFTCIAPARLDIENVLII